MSKAYVSKSGRVIIEVADDAMSAWMTIRKSGRLISEHEITELMDSIGLKFGIEEAVRKMALDDHRKDFDIPFPIAICKEVVGERKIKHYFQSQFSDPKEIDVSMLDNMTPVESGTVLADYSLNIFDNGGSIYNIYGDMQDSTSVSLDTLRESAGEGISFDDKNLRFIANSVGYPYTDKNGKIHLIDSITIEKELTGLVIKTPVALIIKSNVTSCDITSGSDIYIYGNLENSKLYCQGTLTVKGDVFNCQETFLHVVGDVRLESIKHSRLITKSTLSFINTIAESQIIAESGVCCENSFGMIHSGSIQASGSIHAGFLGNPDGIPLDLEVTVSAYYKNLLMIKTKELIKRKQHTNINDREYEELNQHIKELENDLDADMSRFLSEDRPEKLFIQADQTVYPNTVLRILKNTYSIKHPEQGMIYYEKE